MSDRSRAYLASLPLWAALLPLVTFNVCYLIAASLQHVPACMPYLEGCTSVSATGRAAPESVIFKAGMIATAAVFALLWQRTATFLRAEGCSLSGAALLRLFALLAVVSLLIYAATLGLRDETPSALRRIGINGFAVANLATQVAFVFLYRPLRTDSTRSLFRWLAGLCIALPLLGVAAEAAKLLGMPRRPVNNVVAWNGFLLVAGYYAVLAGIWRCHRISSGRPASPRE